MHEERGLNRRKSHTYKEETLSERLHDAVDRVLGEGDPLTKQTINEVEHALKNELTKMRMEGLLNNYEIDCNNNVGGVIEITMKIKPSFTPDFLECKVDIKDV